MLTRVLRLLLIGVLWCCVVSIASKDPICLLHICFHGDCKDMDFGMGALRVLLHALRQGLQTWLFVS